MKYEFMPRSSIHRIGNSKRWSDVVIHAGVARWVEVAGDLAMDTSGQVQQVLRQIDETLDQIGSNRTLLLQITIFLADLGDMATLNEHWDGWVPAEHPPVRACVQAGLGGGCRIEVLVTAAVDRDDELDA